MPPVPQIIRMRRKRWNKYHNTPTQSGGLGLALLTSMFLVATLFGLMFFYAAATNNLPTPEYLPVLLESPDGLLLEPTRFYDQSGEHIIHIVENPAISKRVYIPLDPGKIPTAGDYIPPTLIDSTIAISDPTFWTNPGFTFQRIQQNEHNTLAQRLVSDLLLWNESPGIWRAIRERILGAQIINQYGREKVLEWYLNSIDYGNLAYGAGAAAQIYFGKPASQLSLAEAAILAAVAESPALNPFDSPQTALERGKVVIDAMVGQGLITESEGAEAKSAAITFREPVESQNQLAPAFINLAWEYLSNSIPLNRMERGGFKITTSLDYDLQIQTTCTTRVHLSRIQNAGAPTPVVDGDPCPASQLLPTLTVENRTPLNELSANVIVLDPLNGQILAMVGEAPTGDDHASFDGHPPGSLLTPFIYLTAFTRGFNPASLVWDIEMTGPSMEVIHHEGEYAGPIRLRDALVNDYLIPAVQVINQIGVENVLRTASQFGLATWRTGTPGQNATGCTGCQLILGGGEITLVKAVQAFGVFANQGFFVGQASGEPSPGGLQPLMPVTVLDIQDSTRRGGLPDSEIDIRPVISTQLAYLITHMLSDEAARWPSLGHPNPLEIGRPAGAKQGITLNGKDVWTVGFTPQLVVGVWMGIPEPVENGEIPPKIASALWHAVIQYATQGVLATSWSMPPGVTTLDVCDPSGMLPTLQCPTVVSEIFLTGQEPTQPDTLYQAYQINRETGRLATVFTPPELVEERIYLNVPPEASHWAESIGLDTPPETYDVIYAPVILPDTQIDHPQMFEYLKGIVTIQGRASGSDFASYRLQAGEGLSPSGWTVVQEDTFKPVESGDLGTWDTSKLNGLYALQLIVLRDDQRVDTATVQVTIDNLPPNVEIPYPSDEDTFSSDIDKITFQVKSSDNLGLAAVEFYVDGRLVTTQTQPPFAYPWDSRPGRHVLSVTAIDQAGNQSEAKIIFTVE